MDARLYVIPGSHPARAGMLMLEHKRIPYRRITLVPGFHGLVLRARGFPGRTVPALVMDGRRIQGTCEIARALDELQPEPALLPADPERRRSVEQVEDWAETELQPLARRLAACAGHRDLNELADRGRSGRLGPMLAKGDAGRRIILSAVVRLFGASDERETDDRGRLPGMLDRIDGWIAAGVLDGDEINAADLHVATSLALIMNVRDLSPAIEARPAARLVERVLPEPEPRPS